MSIEPIYGTFAALPFFLIWLYLLWVIVLIGGIVVRTLGLPVVSRQVRHEPALVTCVRALEHLYLAQMRGESVRDDELSEVIGHSVERRDRVFEVLTRLNLIAQTDDERWMLKRNLRALSLWELYEQLPEGVSSGAVDALLCPQTLREQLSRFIAHGSDDLALTLDELFSSSSANDLSNQESAT